MSVGQGEVAGVRLSWASASHRGHVRPTNEDSVFAAAGLYAVADGMGGHERGEVASAAVVEALREFQARNPRNPAAMVASALQQAHRSIEAVARGSGMGTTATGMALQSADSGPQWLIWHVGDSRCYRIRDGIEQITRDHTLVADEVRAGRLTPEEVRTHPMRSILTRAISSRRSPQVEYSELPVRPGDLFLLCSDGLTGEVDDPEICRIVAAATSPAAAVADLITTALAAGGRDNVSAVVIAVEAVAEGSSGA